METQAAVAEPTQKNSRTVSRTSSSTPTRPMSEADFMKKLATNPASLVPSQALVVVRLLESHYAATIKTPDAIAGRLAAEFAFQRLSVEGAIAVLRTFMRPEVGARCVHEPAAMAELSKLIVARVQAEAVEKQMRERRADSRAAESAATWPRGGIMKALRQRIEAKAAA